MYTDLEFQIEGVVPMLMHNGQGVNPSHPIVQQIKVLTDKKKKKTDDDRLKIMELEFHLGIYQNEDGRVIVPGPVLESALRNGARLRRLGKRVVAGVCVQEDPLLSYDGPQTVNTLFADRRFVDVRDVKVGVARVMRTRPRFNKWSLKFSAMYDSTMLDEDQVIRAAVASGKYCGLGDYVPRFGRFEVLKVNGKTFTPDALS